MTPAVSIQRLSALVAARNQTRTAAMAAQAAAVKAREELDTFLEAISKTVPPPTLNEPPPLQPITTLWRHGKRLRFVGAS